MSQGYPDMYQDFSTHRSPGSTRGYNGLALNRQPSRHFNDFQQLPGQYMTADDYAPRYDTERFQRVLPTPVQTHAHYENQTWSYGGAGSVHSLSGTGRVNVPSRGRAPIPTNWMEPQMSHVTNHNPHQLNGQYNTQSHLQNTRVSPPLDSDELIPTAIVIKNIPFAVKKESLMDIMTEMNLPLPYAFNYHFDQGVFRGLAFANFTTAEETSAVIDAMNHMDLQGRKLRVEYKKMLPAAERDRIERDKRERRGQLQEQHQPMSNSALHHQASMSSMNSGVPGTSPSPVHMRAAGDSHSPNIDFNDPVVLSYYSELMLFKNDKTRDTLIFDPAVPPEERRTIHTLAHHMALEHRSEGIGSQRQVTIYKKPLNVSPPIPQLTNGQYNDHRRVLNRAATTDFSEARGSDPGYYSHTLGRQRSDLLDIPGSPGLNGINDRQGALRAAKSFSELRSFSPSPALTTASFPAALAQNVSALRDYGLSSGASGTPPNLTPTSAGNAMNGRDDALINNFGGLNLSSGYDRQTAPRTNARLVGQSDRDNQGSAAGPIGSQRPTNGLYDENPRSGQVVAERQPRGPSEWGNGAGFGRPRQNGHVNRGSGELDLNNLQKTWNDNASQDSSDRSVGPHSSARYNM